MIEIKAIDKNATQDQINIAIQKAKEQIDKNDYSKELIDNKIKNIIKLPIVFVGKKPYILIRN